MNRIALAPTEVSTSSSSTGIKSSQDWLTRARRITDRQATLPYATFAPIHYEERYAYPLLVWLHGDAGSEQELRQVMPLVSMRNFVAIAPRGSRADEKNRRQFDWRQTPDAIELAQSRIADSIAAAQRRFNIHPKRIFLVGRDSGGTMALRVAWNDPGRFAGVGAIHGPLPACLSPMRRVNELRRLPCLLATSRDSQMYPESRVCNDLRLLHVAGCKVTLRHYPGADGLTDIMLSDLNSWLMELVCTANHDS
jgi:phospholipase/carboxylesterase